MTPDRRQDDHQIADLRVVVADHIGRCAELNKLADARHVETLDRMDSMDGKLDKLLAAQDRSKGARWAIAKIAAGVVTLAGGAAWLFDHLK